ncbi:hypoxia-inducible factor 3-alpha isoform X1 [Plutella xylostella]|uniref:hypoxia-inducible factor 3-alpha isoform X1 n=1 Tax=Plutella xylostella TaxID=51655 RepID=UPI002032F57A|nr:hypoxia-inducible factor 3-alpha isoform X1 [Plutella xylostella]
MSQNWTPLPQWLPSMPQYPPPPAPPAPADPYSYYPHTMPLYQPRPSSSNIPPQQLMQQQYYDQIAMPPPPMPRCDNPREIRNKAEKQRRDKLNQSISELAAMVPPVLAASRRIDKTGVLRLTAHYLRAHQHVFGDSIGQSSPDISGATALGLLKAMDGFLLTVTYKGLVVVASQNVQDYIGYTELELLGHPIMNVVHPDDREFLRQQLMPTTPNILGPNGELLVPDDPEAKAKIKQALANERRTFVIRLKKQTQRSEPAQYVQCVVEGSLRKSDRACRGYSRCCQMVRRARARGDNPCASGNDIVFIGLVRPYTASFGSERILETFVMEYHTRHSIDGEIVQSDQKISLITGYMKREVFGLNAMNFMHRDEVRYVLVALKETLTSAVYDNSKLMGESCYRLLTKNGEFIYLRTRGVLEVDKQLGTVKTFICSNTLVDQAQGEHLIKLMKEKYKESIAPLMEQVPQKPLLPNALPLEDPATLKEVIMNLVNSIPKPPPPRDGNKTPLSIVPPMADRICSSIGKITELVPEEKLTGRPKQMKGQETPVIKPVPKQNRAFKANMGLKNQDPFETAFMADTPFPFNADEDLVPKICDEIFRAAPPNGGGGGMGYGHQGYSMKRPNDDVNDGNTFKKKMCETTAFEEIFPEIQEKAVEEFDMSCIDGLLNDPGLDSALNILQAGGPDNEPIDPFSELLLEADFQELFENIDNQALDEAVGGAATF